MKYSKNVDKLYDKIRGNTHYKTLERIINRYSTGGPVERRFKKTIGDIANKGKNKFNISNKVYKAIMRTYDHIARSQGKM